MTQLHLSEKERNVLAETLQSNLADLRYEIADTDSFDYREGLKEKKQIFEGILSALESAG